MSISYRDMRAFNRTTSALRLHAALEESVRPSSRYLSEDARASKIARALRGRDLDTVEICLEAEGLTRNPIVRLALSYARAFEHAYPNSRIRADTPLSDHADGAGPVLSPQAGPASEFSREVA